MEKEEKKGEEPKRGFAMRYIAKNVGKPVAGLTAGAVGVTILGGHPEIRHLVEQGYVVLYPNLPVAGLSTSASTATGTMGVIWSIPPLTPRST